MYSYDPDHDGDNDTCFNFTTKTATTVQNIKYSLGALTVIANFLAIVVILLSKKYKDFTFRLVIYLMTTDILQAVAIILEVIPIEVPNETTPARVRIDGRGWTDFCAASGFIGMITLWMGNIVIVWIVLYLLLLGWRLYRGQQGEKSTRIKLEIIGVLFLFTAPYVIGFIPFLLDNDMYGMAGLWCWIKQMHHVCGDLGKTPLTVVLTFFYGPLIAIVFFAVICMTIIIGLIWCGAVRRHTRTIIEDRQQRLMKETLIVLAYPVLYCSVCLLLLANRVYSIVHYDKTPLVGLWITHAVADPVRVMLPAIGFLLHPYIWKDLCTHKPQTSNSKPERPDHCKNVNSDDTVDDDIEKQLLPAQGGGGDGNKTYGTYDYERYVS